MGAQCTKGVDQVTHLVTEDEIHEAVRSIEEWQKAQANGTKTGSAINAAAEARGPLLDRVGGPDVVRKVVEIFYTKLYADPRLITFLHDQEMMHLRAKQAAFMSWLFGPAGQPYAGKSMRVAHLRLIKERGFSPADFDLGMRYFEEAMSDLGAPEVIKQEVLRRMLPFKDACFTPSPQDAAEEARWMAEEKARADRLHRQEHEHDPHSPSHKHSLGHASGASTAAAAAAAAEAAPDMSRSPSKGAGGGCPFSGARLSRPTSAAPLPPVAAGAEAAVAAAAAAAVTAAEALPPYPDVPKANGGAVGSRPATSSAAAPVAANGGGSRPATSSTEAPPPLPPAQSESVPAAVEVTAALVNEAPVAAALVAEATVAAIEAVAPPPAAAEADGGDPELAALVAELDGLDDKDD
ncbi:hypothetical protein HYH03_012090 [Edaphochlamys debaryana]|uniref:Globin n=1 Tax=Edaphochlamys debaryana TaxID=47281 RepID=A0A835Y1M0_9CHLO|nr:hypothetical protein HYH03_012090 [Edaphochlamys debaryana]|eukprot:KAG2489454.1 hypothetical protein HYH03_012090 [Edaphochlamys debaryana]